jgi:guanylate kinase
LSTRGTETKEKIASRVKVAKWEIKQAHHYKYKVVNHNIDDARNELKTILLNEIKQNV